MNADDVVTNLISLNGGKLVDQARLHTEAYLLQKCGAELEIPFTYHHYGPYSPALAEGWVEAHAGNRIEIERKLRSYGVACLVFRLANNRDDSVATIGALSVDHARKLVETMSKVSDTTLELAGAIVYLRDEEGYGDGVVKEVMVRKPHKATDKRIVGAKMLLEKLGLGAAIG